MFRHQLPLPILFIPLILLAIISLPAGAATFTVTNLNDSGAGSLRQAVLDANVTLGTDTIVFGSAVWGTTALTSGEIAITDALIINGPGAGVLAISGSKTSRIFKISNSANVAINGLTLKDAYIDEYDPLTGYAGGGAIYNQGILTVSNSTLSSSFAFYGGGIYNDHGRLTVNNSILNDNSAISGGGIASYNQGTLTIRNSTLKGNLASSFGGGINSSGTLVIINSTLSANSTGYNGGGISSTGTLTVTNSTLSGNSTTATGGGAGAGGGISHGGTLTVTNSTLSSNSATGTGGGIDSSSASTATVVNSIVAGNIATTGKEIYSGAAGKLTSLGHNLFGENGADGLVNITRVASDRVLPGAIGTAIGSLANNGGPTRTHLPVAGSPVIDAGGNSLIPAGVTTDQRGAGFPRIWPPVAQNGKVDIGAVELRPIYALKVTKIGGNGTVTSNPAGVNCGPTCAATFYDGTSVTLTAKPDIGYSFTGWLGDCTGTTCTLTMNAAKNVTALFSNATTHLLTVTKVGVGLGTVTGPGITCGADCTQPYLVGAKVTLTATATAGSTFGGWSNCDTVNVALRQCTVTMANARTVKATFNRPLLTVSKTGAGANLVGTFGLSSGIFCGTDCTEAYNLGTVVYLVALPRPGSTFVGWNNCVANANFPQLCTTTMTVSKTVTAKFSP